MSEILHKKAHAGHFLLDAKYKVIPGCLTENMVHCTTGDDIIVTDTTSDFAALICARHDETPRIFFIHNADDGDFRIIEPTITTFRWLNVIYAKERCWLAKIRSKKGYQFNPSYPAGIIPSNWTKFETFAQALRLRSLEKEQNLWAA